MTLDLPSSALSPTPRRTHGAQRLAAQDATVAGPPGAADRAWRLGYMTVSLLAIASAAAIAGGETGSAELRFATAAVRAVPLPQDICSASGDVSAPLAPDAPRTDRGAFFSSQTVDPRNSI